MTYTNSPLVNKTKLSSKHNDREQPISKITIHHSAGVMSFDALLDYVATCPRDMSANYVLRQGKIGLVVEEKYRAWTSCSAWNDHRAVTIEVGNSSSGGQWPISDEDLALLIKWCADVCKRNNIPKLYYDGTPNGSLTLHEMFTATGCPGPYIKSKINYICTEVNKLINSTKNSNTTSTKPAPADNKTYKVVTNVYGYISAADAIADKNRKRTVTPGTYYIYNETSKAVNVSLKKSAPGAWICKAKNVKTSTSTSTAKKSIETIAKEVISGKWGNGSDRIKKLKAAGYDATAVQKKVNELLSGTTSTKKSVATVAKEVLQGKWGNGEERKKKLEAAGYNYSEVQAAVNKLL